MAPEPHSPSLQLPTQIVGPADLARLARELDALDDFLLQAAAREPGSASPNLPRPSRSLDELVMLNKINLEDSKERRRLADALAELKNKGLILHISFASDPSAAFVDKIVNWLRTNIHPLLLVRVGLEPTVGAGCIIRTANRQFDFSLGHHFFDNQPKLIELLQKTGED